MRIAIGSDHAGFELKEAGTAALAALDNGILEWRRKTYEFVLYFRVP